MDIIIEKLKENEIELFNKLVIDVFDEFVGVDYSDEGNKTFKDFTNTENVLERMNNENNKFFIAKSNNEICGVLETKNDNHISLFFVKKEYHNKGIGKKVFQHFLNELKQENKKHDKITVNSSIYAEKVYAKMGFVKTGELQEKNGIKFIPMVFQYK